MVFTQGLRHTFLGWSRGFALVQSLLVQPSFASFRGGVVEAYRWATSEFGDVAITWDDPKNLYLVFALSVENHVPANHVASDAVAQPWSQLTHFWLRSDQQTFVFDLLDLRNRRARLVLRNVT